MKLEDIQEADRGLPVTHAVIHVPGLAHFHPGVAGVEVETGVAEEAGVGVKDMVVEELVLLAEEVIGLLVDPQ